MESAKRMHDRWATLTEEQIASFARSITEKVKILADSVEITFNARSVASALIDDYKSKASQSEDKQPLPMVLSVGARIKRTGRVIQLVLEGPDATPVARKINPELLQILARANLWFGQLNSGEAKDQRSIAQRYNLDEGYVARAMQCAFLAPEIVRMLLVS